MCVWISALRNALGTGREGSSHVLEQPSALNIHPCVPLSLPVFFVIAQAWVPRSGQRTLSRCDVSRVWIKAAWSWGASFRFLFPTGVTWGERQQNYKIRGPVWPGWDFMFIEKWILIWKSNWHLWRHSEACFAFIWAYTFSGHLLVKKVANSNKRWENWKSDDVFHLLGGELMIRDSWKVSRG